ncbi:MAG TPA: amino acid adenylation domain-containing protein [Thermoanaerobaculia bacterium]|jgi:amino acid adenylation domain-containing protein|nr:amino acid adenylation domain-containing protein [Thermoanaerobaculia bacterium]
METETLQGFRLSPQQRWLWLLHQEHPACRVQCSLALDGDLDGPALRRAVNALVARHDILRTTFHRAPGVKVPIQTIAERGSAAWSDASLASLGPEEQEARINEMFQQEMRRPFDLERGPVLRAVLIELAPHRHELFLSLPGICADGWTLANAVREIAELYGAGAREDTAADEVVQYLQFSEWQNELLGEEGDRAARERWRRFEPAGYYGLRLPLEGSGAGPRSFAPNRTVTRWDAATTTRLEALARERDTSVETVLFAFWLALLFRLTQCSDLAVGALFDGRKIADLHATLGPFAKTVPVRCPLADELTFGEILERAVEAYRAAADGQEYFVPEELAAPDTTVREAPVLFELSKLPATCTAAGIAFSPRGWYLGLDRFKVKLACVCGDGGIRTELQYDPRLFRPQDMERLAERFATLMQALLDAPGTPLGNVNLLSAVELQELLVAFNGTDADYPADRCLHQLVAEQASRTPAETAVAAAERRMTYAELDAAADRLAGRLRTLGVGPEARVAVCLSRGPELLVAILAVWKAGGAFVPLDPAYPRDRLAWMLEDSQPRVVLTETALAGMVPEGIVAARILLDAAPAAEPAAASVMAAGAAPDDLAYVLYTSGSTGRPKGVMVPHRGLVNYLWWSRGAYGLGAGGSAPVHSPIGFDLTLTSLLGPLLAGGTVVLLPEDQGVDALGEALMGDGGFSLAKLTPAHLEVLRRRLAESETAQGARLLVLGGEALYGEALVPWREKAPEIRVVNEYGPTETVVGSCAYEVPPGSPEPGAVPIGRPIANTRMYLLDGRLDPVPWGVAGEIFIGGAGIARGYQRLPAATAERFVPDPFGARPGGRLYRTGDLGRHLPNGHLEYLGRSDGQVKIRGFRIELGEIEAVLTQHPAVREAAVLAREDTRGDRRLVAYVVAAESERPRSNELRRFLAAALPEPMVPSALVLLPAMPLTPNGKVDRRALPAPGPERPDLEQAYVAPRTPVEEVLAPLWATVLGLDRVGVHDSFFALGGDSIRSVRVVALAKERGLDFVIQDLFRFPTVAALAAHVGTVAGLVASAPAEVDSAELAEMLAEIDGLSDEAVRAQLREKLLPNAGSNE